MKSEYTYKEVDGDLFNVIRKSKRRVFTAHGCNCFSRMKRGIAPLMNIAFGCASYPMELKNTYRHKLGNIDGVYNMEGRGIHVYNMYTQFHWKEPSRYGIPLDYDAMRLCFRKLNQEIEIMRDRLADMDRKIELIIPKIGCGFAGGDWNKVRKIVQEEIDQCRIIVVNYKKG